MAYNEVMIKGMRSWYNSKFGKNDAGCILNWGSIADPVLTNNNQRRIAFWGMV